MNIYNIGKRHYSDDINCKPKRTHFKLHTVGAVVIPCFVCHKSLGGSLVNPRRGGNTHEDCARCILPSDTSVNKGIINLMSKKYSKHFLVVTQAVHQSDFPQ